MAKSKKQHQQEPSSGLFMATLRLSSSREEQLPTPSPLCTLLTSIPSLARRNARSDYVEHSSETESVSDPFSENATEGQPCSVSELPRREDIGERREERGERREERGER